ncbi:shugoshin 2 isoform X2 [Bufo gargarizans]|nr:shugoshin 2 isoform X2 [Bufo gargarizans]
MDLTSSPSVSTLQSVKERLREKLQKSLKAVKLQMSLAAKIKTKTLNNSSVLKLSLKHNNKALASALTAEREKSRRLGNENMFLQKEVKMLHFQNALLRQNLSSVNKMLKDINVFMNINLPAAIELSGTMESSDCLSLNGTRSERFSQQSALSLDGDQGFRLTGVALRVPSNCVEQQKCNSLQNIHMSEESHLIVPPAQSPAAVRESCEKLDELEMHTSNLSSKVSECNENRSPDSPSSGKFRDSILPLDEVFSYGNRNVLSGGFVTKRKKRSTVSHSSMGSKKSEGNQARSLTGESQEILPSTHWEISTDIAILPDSGHTGLGGTKRSDIESVLQKDSLSRMSHGSSLAKKLDTNQNSDVDQDSKVLCKEQATQSTNRAELVQNEESDHHTVHGQVGQEETVYEADMDMTSSESASIIAVLPKNKMQASKTKSGIPVKQTGKLRKVKKSVREKPKRIGSSVDQEADDSSNSNENEHKADKFIDNLTSDRHDYRRTYVLPEPVVEDRLDVLESHTQSDLEVSASTVSCIAGEIFPHHITTVSNGENDELTFTLEKDHSLEEGKIANVAPKKRKSKNISMVESSRKRKRRMYKLSKAQEQLAEESGNLSESTEQMESSRKMNNMPSIHVKHQEPKLRRETYVISAPEQNPVTHDAIAKVHGVNYRRETFVITEPNPLVSVAIKTTVLEERDNKSIEPQNSVKSLVPTDISCNLENRLDYEVEHCHSTSNPGPAYGYKKRVTRYLEKKTASGIFSELDKRKTHILPRKQDGVRDEKGTLVRESFMNRKSNQSDKTSKIPDVKVNAHDSFMLDMVSESILENTMEFSSFAEFPSATNSENTFTIDDMSLKSIHAPELPMSEDCNNEIAHFSDNINVLAENDNGHQKDTHETEIGNSQQCKVEDQSMEIPETAIKPFQDLTNKSLGSTKQSPKSCSEEESHGHHRRRRNPVNYKEPSLGKKLRR